MNEDNAGDGAVMAVWPQIVTCDISGRCPKCGHEADQAAFRETARRCAHWAHYHLVAKPFTTVVAVPPARHGFAQEAGAR